MMYRKTVGVWKKRFRLLKGEALIARFEDNSNGSVRNFCSACGTPLYYERARSKHMINIPRALFESRTGRQPIYHIGIEELQEWAYTGGPLTPLKGFPGVVWNRSAKKKRADDDPFAVMSGRKKKGKSPSGRPREQMEVVGSDGKHIGKVDNVMGADLQLTRSLGVGSHHLLPLDYVELVDDKVRLNITEDEAKIRWRELH